MAGETTPPSQNAQEQATAAASKAKTELEAAYSNRQKEIDEIKSSTKNKLTKLNDQSHGILKIMGNSILQSALFILSYIILSMLCHYNEYNVMKFSILYTLIFGIVFVFRYFFNNFWSYFSLIVSGIIIIWIMEKIFSNKNEQFKYKSYGINKFRTFIPIYDTTGSMNPDKSKIYSIVSVIILIIVNLVLTLTDDYNPTDEDP